MFLGLQTLSRQERKTRIICISCVAPGPGANGTDCCFLQAASCVSSFCPNVPSRSYVLTPTRPPVSREARQTGADVGRPASVAARSSVCGVAVVASCLTVVDWTVLLCRTRHTLTSAGNRTQARPAQPGSPTGAGSPIGGEHEAGGAFAAERSGLVDAEAVGSADRRSLPALVGVCKRQAPWIGGARTGTGPLSAPASCLTVAVASVSSEAGGTSTGEVEAVARPAHGVGVAAVPTREAGVLLREAAWTETNERYAGSHMFPS